MIAGIILAIAVALWGAVLVWDFNAKALTPALFWSRLIAPLLSAFLLGIALYLMICGKK